MIFNSQSTCAVLFQTPCLLVSRRLPVLRGAFEFVSARKIHSQRKVDTNCYCVWRLLVARGVKTSLCLCWVQRSRVTTCQVLDGRVQEFQNNIVKGSGLSFQFLIKTSSTLFLLPFDHYYNTAVEQKMVFWQCSEFLYSSLMCRKDCLDLLKKGPLIVQQKKCPPLWTNFLLLNGQKLESTRKMDDSHFLSGSRRFLLLSSRLFPLLYLIISCSSLPTLSFVFYSHRD